MSGHVDPAALSSSTGSARTASLAHLAGCADCRGRAVAYDPAILFSLLALAPVPGSTLDAVSVEVARLAGRDHAPIGALAEAATWPRRAAAAAALGLALLCGYTMRSGAPVAPAAMSLARPRADVDVESGRGVSQVIDLTVGETQLVMVYNGNLKL